MQLYKNALFTFGVLFAILVTFVDVINEGFKKGAEGFTGMLPGLNGEVGHVWIVFSGELEAEGRPDRYYKIMRGSYRVELPDTAGRNHKVRGGKAKCAYLKCSFR